MGGVRAIRLCVSAALLGLVLAAPAGAQPGETFEALVKKLDAPELSIREGATAQLAQGDRFSLPMIEKSLTDSSLSPEQRQRLRWAGQQLFGRTARAAMGISFMDWEDSGAVVSPVKGFDSERVLREGDLLATIGGQRMTGQNEVRQIIISHDPGDEVTLGIIRSGTPMTVTVKMGRLADLPNMGDRRTPAPPSLSGAWSYRLARLGEPRPAPVASSLDAQQWRESAERAALAEAAGPEQMHVPFTGEPVRSVMNRPPVSSLALGGQSRHSGGEDSALAQRNGPFVIQRGARGNILIRDGNIVFRDQGALDRAERDGLRMQLGQLRGVVAANNARLNDPSVPEPEKALLKVQNEKVSAALRAIEARILQLSRVPEVRP